MISRDPKLIGFGRIISVHLSKLCASYFWVSLLYSICADAAVQQQTCCSVLMCRSWPEPLLQVDRMASCKAAPRQQLPLAAVL